MNQGRDMGVHQIRSDRSGRCSGMGLGIILVDESYQAFPGDTRNPSAFPFPIQYEVAEGVDFESLIYSKDKSGCLASIRKAAKRLEEMGCRAIAADCGYFAYFQRDIAAHVSVPVFLSSLLQVPLAQQIIGPEKTVGILVALKEHLASSHLDGVGVQPDRPWVVQGLAESGCCPGFAAFYGVPESQRGTAEYEQLGEELVAAGCAFYKAHPNMGAMVLECSNTQPWARVLQREIGIPVFSWGTLLDYAYSVVAHRDYYGHV